MFERVLIPLDGSPLAEAILPLLKPLIRRVEAEVILVQVAQYPAVPGASGYVPLVEFEEPAREYIRGRVAGLSEEGIRARGVVRVGPAADGILDAVEAEGASMIALTTHGRSGVSRWVMGSVTERVVRSSPVPVLAIRSFPREGSRSAHLAPQVMFAPRKILVPLDGSENSLGIVPWAISLARRFEAQATLLRVHEAGEAPDAIVPPDRATGRPFPRQRPARPFGEAAVQAAVRTFMDAGVPAQLAESTGDPGTGILKAAYDSGAELIAMATHGRSGPTRWMLGSVTEKVLRASELPMLIVRSPRLRR